MVLEEAYAPTLRHRRFLRQNSVVRPPGERRLPMLVWLNILWCLIWSHGTCDRRRFGTVDTTGFCGRKNSLNQIPASGKLWKFGWGASSRFSKTWFSRPLFRREIFWWSTRWKTYSAVSYRWVTSLNSEAALSRTARTGPCRPFQCYEELQALLSVPHLCSQCWIDRNFLRRTDYLWTLFMRVVKLFYLSKFISRAISVTSTNLLIVEGTWRVLFWTSTDWMMNLPSVRKSAGRKSHIRGFFRLMMWNVLAKEWWCLSSYPARGKLFQETQHLDENGIWRIRCHCDVF